MRREKKIVDQAVGQRMREALQLVGASQAQLAAEAGGTVRGIQDNIAGKAMPGGRTLQALSARGINTNWVLTGQGEPLVEQQKKNRIARYDGAQPIAEYTRGGQPRPGYVYLPLYDVRAAAGGGRLPPDHPEVENELAFKEDWIRHTLHAAPEDLGLAHVEGDSMVGDLNPGDIFLYNRRDTSARREGIYFLDMEGTLLVKRVQRKPGGVLRLISKNEAYEPVELPMTELDPGGRLRIIGRVVWACRRL